MGTPEFAVPSLQALLKSHHEVVGVVTSPDKPRGRGRIVSPSPVKKLALERNLLLFQPEDLKDPQFIDSIKKLTPDLIVVVAFRILPRVLFELPPLGTINLHASLLPKYRGAAPINWAIINGEKETGVTTFFIEEKVDSGDIILQKRVPIEEEETAGELHDKLAILGAEALLETLDLIEKGQAPRIKQTGEPTKAPKIKKKDCQIDWSKSSTAIVNLIRGLSPYPGAFTTYKGKILKIHRARVSKVKKSSAIPPGRIVKSREKEQMWVKSGDGVVLILELQPEGRRRMTAGEFLRGHPLKPGDQLGEI